MDMATILGMFGGGAGAPAGGMQMPAAQLGAAQMGGQPQQAGFGMGQPLVQGQMGGAQMAQPQTMLSQLQGLQLTPEMIQKLGPMGAAMLQGQPSQQNQMTPQMMNIAGRSGGPLQGQTQASRGYLAQGGGVAPRSIVTKGY